MSFDFFSIWDSQQLSTFFHCYDKKLVSQISKTKKIVKKKRVVCEVWILGKNLTLVLKKNEHQLKNYGKICLILR